MNDFDWRKSQLFPYFAVGLLVVSVSLVHNTVTNRAIANYVPPPGTASEGANQKRQRFAYWGVAAILVAFAGLRYRTGTDYTLYLALYDAVDPNSITDTLARATQDVGFVTLMFVVKNMTDFPYIIFWVSSALTVLPILYAIKRKSIDPVFAVFLYFFMSFYAVSFNAVRQSIAVSFLLLAETYRSESRVKYVALSAAAISFHSSAVLIVVIQSVIRFWKPTYLSVFALLIATIPLSSILLRSNALRVIPSELNSRYIGYLQGADGGGIGTVLLLLAQIALIFLVLSLPRVTDADRHIALVSMSAVFLYLGLSTWVIARLVPYFSIFILLLLPNQLAAWRYGYIAKWSLSCATIVYFAIHITKYNDVIPYRLVPELQW